MLQKVEQSNLKKRSKGNNNNNNKKIYSQKQKGSCKTDKERSKNRYKVGERSHIFHLNPVSTYVNKDV